MPQPVREVLIRRWSHRGRKLFHVACLEIQTIAEVSVISRKICSIAMRGIGERIVVRGNRDQARHTQPLRIRVDPPDSSRQAHHG
jgi:hypothetical protein